jgi:peptidoglycan glycosyltransferase
MSLNNNIFITIGLSLSTPIFANALLIPKEFPTAAVEQQAITIPDESGAPVKLSLIPEMQDHLSRFIVDRGNPIAAVLALEVKTGKILAMAQGRTPQQWNGTQHSALHNLFPAASLFKTVVAGAAFDIADIDPVAAYGLEGGCADVRPTGVWLNDQVTSLRHQLNLFKAFGNSCNGFFAKIAVNQLGLKTLVEYAQRFGWDGKIAADFHIEKSPLNAPSVRNSSVHTVGRFAAGFGSVGMSAVHAAWMMNAIANKGVKQPIFIREDSSKIVAPQGSSLAAKNPDELMISALSADKLRSVMQATVLGGTASFAFRRGKHRKYREMVGGKTGTLTGHAPEGVTTWFAGMMPLEDPEVIVAAVVVLEDLWHIKGPNLAAEAFWAYDEFVRQKARLAHSIEVH